MRTYKVEHMRPEELLAEQQRRSIIYFTSGPLEWHSLHNPYGVDGFLAYRLACMACEKTGGVVLPPFFMGSDHSRSKEHLEKFGFDDTEQYIMGMDFPKNCFDSFYLPTETVVSFIREYMHTLIDMKYKLIVVMGHGGDQMALTGEMCKQLTATTDSTVLLGNLMRSGDEATAKAIGHANVTETSMMMYMSEEDVDLTRLPPKEEKLKYCDWGILDRSTVLGDAPADHCVINDPRESTYAYGERLMTNSAESLAKQVNEVYKGICE